MRDLINKLTLLESDGNNIPKIASQLRYEDGRIIFKYKVPNPTIVKFNFGKPFELKIQYIQMHFLIDENGNLVHDIVHGDPITFDPISKTVLDNFMDFGDRSSFGDSIALYEKAVMPLLIDAGISRSAAENFPQDMEAINHGFNKSPSEVEEEINAAFEYRSATYEDMK